MSEEWVKSVKGGNIYTSQNMDGDDSQFIVTAVGLNHILFADYPFIKFNGNYLEYCVTRKEFKRKFKALGETK